mgnify:CR=1 FL=1
MSDSYKRRPVNNDGGGVFEGLQIPPSLPFMTPANAGYQQLRSSSEIASEPIGAPYKRLDTQGRSWYSARCFWIMFILLVLAIIACGLIVGFTVRHSAIENGDRSKCGSRWIRDGEICVKVIVVGAGTTTSSTVEVLSLDPSVSIAVFEAGPDNINDDNMRVITDGLKTEDLPFDEANKYHRITNGPTEQGFGLAGVGRNGRGERFVMGEMLGGSSEVNNAVLVKESIAYYDELDTSLGSPGYFDGATMYATIQSMEYYQSHGSIADVSGRGDGSLPTQRWKVERLPQDNNEPDLLAICSLLSGSFGIPFAVDKSYNAAGNDIGQFYGFELLYDFDVTPRKHWGARETYFRPEVMDQTTYQGVAPRNFRVYLNSTVTDLIIDESTKRVIGVVYTDNHGVQRKAYAEVEVVLGANIRSTSLMQRAGIREGGHIVDNPNVGANYEVGPYLTYLFYWPNATGTYIGDVNTITASTIVGGVTQTFMEDFSSVGLPGRRGFQLLSVAFPSVIGFFDAPLRTKSRGRISIYANDAFKEVNLTTGIWTHPDDLLSVREHIRYVVNSIQSYDPNAFFLSIAPPVLADDAMLDQWIKDTNLNLNYHHFGFSRMGVSIANSVVDTRFRVHGVTGLRECDTGVIPFAPDGNPSWMLTAIGKRCGEFILEDMGSLFAAKSMNTEKRQEQRALIRELQRRTRREPGKHVSNRTPKDLPPLAHTLSRQRNKRDDAAMFDILNTAFDKIRASFPHDISNSFIDPVVNTPMYAEFMMAHESAKKKKTA